MTRRFLLLHTLRGGGGSGATFTRSLTPVQVLSDTTLEEEDVKRRGIRLRDFSQVRLDLCESA